MLKGYDPQGMTWHEANLNLETRERYNTLLVLKGLPIIAGSGDYARFVNGTYS